MLFNKDNKGAAELRAITGSYYANNDFKKIAPEINFAIDDVAKVVGRAVVEKAETDYAAGTENDLIRYVQAPVAFLATFNMYRKNGISHEDGGRKVKISETGEKMPWEWMIDRDDAAHLEAYYQNVDRLIDYLNRSNNTEWTASDQYKNLQSQIMKSATLFNDYFPIDNSSRFFILISPFVREAERTYIKPALGDDYDAFRSGSLSDDQKALLPYVLAPIPLFALAIALRRMAYSIIPAGVMKRVISSSQTANAGETPTLAELKRGAKWLEMDAEKLLNLMKIERRGVGVTQVIPNNKTTNKFFRV